MLARPSIAIVGVIRRCALVADSRIRGSTFGRPDFDPCVASLFDLIAAREELACARMELEADGGEIVVEVNLRGRGPGHGVDLHLSLERGEFVRPPARETDTDSDKSGTIVPGSSLPQGGEKPWVAT